MKKLRNNHGEKLLEKPGLELGFSIDQPSLFEQFKDLLFGNVLKLAFIVDVYQVNLLVLGNQVGDHPSAAGLTFTLGCNGQADFMNAMSQVNPGIRFFFEGSDKALEISF